MASPATRASGGQLRWWLGDGRWAMDEVAGGGGVVSPPRSPYEGATWGEAGSFACRPVVHMAWCGPRGDKSGQARDAR